MTKASRWQMECSKPPVHVSHLRPVLNWLQLWKKSLSAPCPRKGKTTQMPSPMWAKKNWAEGKHGKNDVSSGRFWKYIWHRFSGILPDIFSGIFSDIEHLLWHSVWHCFRHSFWHLFWHSFWPSISDIYFDVLARISYGILPGILSDRCSDILSGMCARPVVLPWGLR